MNPLFAEHSSLTGIGPKISRLLEGLCGPGLVSLCWHLPTGIIDRRYRPEIAQAEEGRIATFEIEVVKHTPSRRRGLPYRVLCKHPSGFLTLVFFNAKADWLMRRLPIGEHRLVSGRVERYRESIQIVHPDHILTQAEYNTLPEVEPVYPMTAGVTSKPLYKAIKGALAEVPDLPEWQNPDWLKNNDWADWKTALLKAHQPEEAIDLRAGNPARQRLAYDELLANQLALGLVRKRRRAKPGRSLSGDGRLQEKLTAELPFQLTEAQIQALQEIHTDMGAPTRMLRLLQGDVGSGKTVIALLSMLAAVETGAQAAIMAPTEILARQHAETLIPLCDAIGVRCDLLTGRDKGKKRDALLAQFENGETQIAIGTHALFQDDVAFDNLAMVVVDEQHRFGVHQRMTLSAKGDGTDVLVMTATPIPRTLTLAAYGDMDVSRLTGKPPGRKPVETRLIDINRLDEVIGSLNRLIETGQRAYWVCPLVAENEVLDLAAAEDRADSLHKIYGDRVGLVHGQMKGPDKDRVMKKFQTGEIDILVSTTVIEVGVNVPEASVMIIEHAERFGLSQLHQLRGRVGRGSEQSSCLLLYRAPLGETATARLKIMRDTDDGFLIAEEDLRLRGAGELLGTRQSGLPVFKLADLELHAQLLPAVHDDARYVLETDPELKTQRGAALRLLLYLFRRDEAIRYLESG